MLCPWKKIEKLTFKTFKFDNHLRLCSSKQNNQTQEVSLFAFIFKFCQFFSFSAQLISAAGDDLIRSILLGVNGFYKLLL